MDFTPNPVAFTLFGLDIRWYALLICAGMIIGSAIAYRRCPQRGIKPDDLLDTLKAHKDNCVGMAANMIGVNRCIIAFQDGAGYTVMLNPKILQKSGAYETEEGCLSLTGVRPVKRWKRIKVRWQNEKLEIRIKTYTGWTAEIIQHEIDHCEGILI